MVLFQRISLLSILRRLLCFISLSSLCVGAEEIIPDFYQDPGIYPNRSYVNQNANEHIDPFTGGLQLHYVDIHLPGNGGFDINVTRSYNSASVDPNNPAAYKSLAGLGWTIHFGRVIKSGNANICLNDTSFSVANNPVLELPDGSRQQFAFTDSSSPLMLTTQFWKAECIVGNINGLSVYSPDGIRYDMTHLVTEGTGPRPVYVWYTTRITDRNGNYADISYAASFSPEISRITTSDNRVINFTYADSGLPSRRITQISSAGQIYTYTYYPVSNVLDKYFLTNVTRPDGAQWQYSYNASLNTNAGSYVMNRVIYPQGGYIDYLYEFVNFDSNSPYYRSTVVARKSTSTGGVWSFNYQPGSFNVPDSTTVYSPSGSITYRHIGPNYSSSGTVWMVGLLVSKTIENLQTETYNWDKQKISSENNFRPGNFVTSVDSDTYSPILLNKQITRDGASYITEFSNFDGYGNPRTISEAGPNGGNRTTALTYFYNPDKWIVKQVKNESFDGSLITRSFDSNGSLREISQDGVVTRHDYDSEGNIRSTTFPRSLTHSYSNHKRGIPQLESQPEGIQINRIVSDAGNVVSETNGEGYTTSYRYDGLNRLTHIDYPSGNNVSITWGVSTKSATRGSLTENTIFDGFGRTVSHTLGGITHTYQYDALGRKIFASNPNSGSGTSYRYDALDRVTRIVHPDNTSIAISYGGGFKTVTDERNKSTKYSFRAYGNPDKTLLMNIAAPEAAASIDMQRNSKGLVTSVTQNGFTRAYTYNGNYYLISVNNPETGVTTYGRDAAGNMISRTVGSSGTTTYRYDGQNRLVSVTYPGNTPSITNTYNKTHKLVNSSSSVASRSFNYDANSNLTSESVTVDGRTFTTSYAYNGNDQITAITYPHSGRIVNYAPDVLGRPTLVSDFVTGVTYWPSGQIRQINYANGMVTNYNQNSRLWPSTVSAQNSSGVYYLNNNYSYDGAGNLTAISDSFDSNYNRTMGYDDINRLISITGPWGTGAIAYNGAGNITSQSLGGFNLSYSYDGQNRLSAISGSRTAVYAYDAYGNIIADASKTFTYDDATNLRCVNCNDPAKKIEYAYDNANQRISVTKGNAKTYEIYGSHGNLLIEYVPGTTDGLTEYIYLGGRRIAQVQTGNTSSGAGGTISTIELLVTSDTVGQDQVFTLTANVSGDNPTGTVTFMDGTTVLGSATLESGQASISVSLSTVGTHNITANYEGDGKHRASSSTMTLTVEESVIEKVMPILMQYLLED